MIWVDVAILSIVAVSVIISLWRGFTREALSLAGWITAFWIALTFSEGLERILRPLIAMPSVRLLTSFAVLFAMTLMVASLVSFFAVHFIESTGLGGTDRMIGILFGVLRGCFIVVALVILAGLTPLPRDPWWQASMFLGYFQDVAVWIRDLLPPQMAENIRYR